MPLIAGSVTVAPDGAVTASGLAGQVYTRLEANSAFQGPPGVPMSVAAKRQLAGIANAVATLADYVKANAQISTTDSGGVPIAWAGTGSGTVA